MMQIYSVYTRLKGVNDDVQAIVAAATPGLAADAMGISTRELKMLGETTSGTAEIEQALTEPGAVFIRSATNRNAPWAKYEVPQ